MPVAAMLLSGTGAAGGGGGGPFYRSITIDHTKVGTVDHTDFPVLFSGTYSYLKSAANGGKVQNTASGLPCDLTFSSDSAGASLYKYNVVYWDATTGTIEAWVKIPTVSHTSDTVFYLRYDDSSIVTYQGDNHATWNTAYLGVWHLDNGTTLNTGDSTANAQALTNGSATAAAGQIDGAAAFNGSASLTKSASSLTSASAWTLQAWAYITGGSSFRSIALVGNGTTRNMHIDIDGTPKARAVLTQGSSNFKVATGSTTLSSNTWYLIHGRYNGSTLQVFVNGSSDASTAVTGSADTGDPFFALGALAGASFTGRIDEARVSNVARSDSWILAEYNNQSSPSTFYTVGPET